MYLGIQGQSGAGQWNLWKPALDDPKYKDIRGVKQLCDYFLEDGSFLKIDAITLGYTLALSSIQNGQSACVYMELSAM